MERRTRNKEDGRAYALRYAMDNEASGDGHSLVRCPDLPLEIPLNT
jgi:hypothetical protein